MTSIDTHHQFLYFNWTKPLFTKILHSLNCSEYRLNEHHNPETSDIIQAAQFGVISAILFIFILDKVLLKTEYLKKKNSIVIQWPSFVNLQFFMTILSLTFFILISPILFAIITFFFTCKQITRVLLKLKYGKRFNGMIEGTDTVWAMEEETGRSIINVICLLKPDSINDSNDLLESVKKIMWLKLIGKQCICPKLKYIRAYEYGYHFWKTADDIQLENIIKPMDIPDNELNEDRLQEYVSNISNTKLPYNNKFSWEILVGAKPMSDTNMFPILFRIHHSLGDGVALLKLLLNIAGMKMNKPNEYKSHGESVMYFYDLYDWRKTYQKIVNFIKSFIKAIQILILMPVCLVRQALRPPDDNAMHGPELSGRKIISWISDDHDSVSLLHKIKCMKKNIPGATFSELFLMALSLSCEKYLKTRYTTPEFLTAVVPVRMDSSNDTDVQMENKFSVAMLTVPLEDDGTEDFNAINRLTSVRKETNKLRQTSDFYVNYWLMKIGGFALPEFILKSLLTSVQATLVVSNLPGPSDVTICNDYVLKKLSFFVPHRGTTGIGITIMSCNDRLHLGIMADSNLISSRRDATGILKNIISELEKLDNIIHARSHENCSEIRL